MKPKVYCAGPISGDNTFQSFYKKIIYVVENCGCKALYEPNLIPNAELTDQEIFKRDIRWINESDVIIAEVSGPSLGVGFEIAYALYVLKKPVLALYNTSVKRLSAMIKGCDANFLSVQLYRNESELENYIKLFIKNICSQKL